jgi:septal ring factor EnvC (AmiA/AmiB activator)
MPVDAPVVDPFRPPTGPYGPGNRGWELDTTPGQIVVAVGAGTVTFAGPVAGRGVVVVAHPDGLRSSLTGLAGVDTVRGRSVARGQPVGTAGETLHLGFRLGEEYLDPALLVGAAPTHAVLVPVPPG